MGKLKGNVRKASKSRGVPHSGMGRDILAVAVMAAAIVLGLALLTFSASDAPLVARGLPTASNLVGPVGHRVARDLYRVLGFASLVIPLGLAVFALKIFRDVPGRLTVLASLAHGVLALSVATLAHLTLASRHLSSFPPGGAVGRLLSGRAEALFSPVGAGLIVGACGLVALIVATDFQVRKAAFLVAGILGWLASFIGRHFVRALDRHREAVAELRASDALERSTRAEADCEAVVLGKSLEDEEEGRGVAGALAAEQARRLAMAGDPAWVEGLVPGDEELEGDGRKRRSRAKETLDAACDATDEGQLALEGAEEVPLDEEPLPPAPKPEIVLSQAMLERGKKKKDAREAPAFAFTPSGEVFRLPSSELLDQREVVTKDVDEGGLQRTAEVITATLRQHGIDGIIKHIRPGPVVTLYEFIPVAGVKLARIENLDKELTMALSATRIRIIAPIPGKGVVGIEVPNRDRALVYLREVLESESFANAGGLLPLALGKNIEGIPYCVDLQKMPHLLVAGTTGSGKSVGLNTMILSLLYRQTPDEVRFIMVDPKMTELSIYEDIPHLLLPVVTDPAKAARALQWAVDEMERRTQVLADTGSKDLKSYNAKAEKLRAEGRTFAEASAASEGQQELLVLDVPEAAPAAELAPTPPFEDPTLPKPPEGSAFEEAKRLPQKLPYVVVIIDELADLMMTAPREVEISLARLAQKARATGIHLMVATQRPSTDVVTGMIKNNFPARISFRLASRHDSATIINGPGAEALLGDGDMLVLTATQPVTRVQGAFVSEGEIERVVRFLKEQGRPVYDDSILKARDAQGPSGDDSEEDDPTYDQALDLVSRMEEVSVSKLQREMRLGYNKAAKIVERMEREGVVGPANGVKPRQVLIRPAGEANPYPNV
ncbi:MAG TPA: DNA translocase FtsK 4TM domain-containing protein [Anaeromyxobacteraceae bacterium]|nr:DNA translocase FtsK 4TM domain-containing protein [Anaeromyxobacteraceae bacterium]